MMFWGVRIFEDLCMVEPAGEDWSRVRSPARARRRRRKHRQNIVQLFKPLGHAYRVPDGRGSFVYVMHPDMAAELRRQATQPPKFGGFLRL